ncbi:MAG: DNA polymerase/3'-5' exonuclease PolX [Anaerolineales bacterium]
MNTEIANIFTEMADLLEIEGANPFRVRAYRRAARTVSGYTHSMAELVREEEDLTELSGIGEDLAGKIKEIVETGSLTKLKEVKSRTPADLTRMLNVAGLGPKRVKALYDELKISTLTELEQAAAEGRIHELHGFGEKIEQQILKDLQREDRQDERVRIDVAEEIIQPLVRYLKSLEGAERVEVAGSYRRRKETVGDLDLLITSDRGKEIIDRFVNYEDVVNVLSQGETRSTVEFRSGMQVDLRVVSEESYGAALFYFTGSKEHNIAIRNLALDQGLKVNEYGVFREEERVAGESEAGIYALLGLAYVEPELREDRGEVRAAQQGTLPALVTLEEIRGDLQCHTQASDGEATLREMAEAAQARGYDYLAITDHSAYIGIVQGLDEAGVAAQIDEMDRLNDALEGFRLLKAIEVDIMENGDLDLPDEILARLDLRVCAIHSKFNLSREEQTERIIRAMDNPYFNILAHPTGRRIGKRAPYALDMKQVLDAARERGCFLEINAQPERLDLDDVAARMAKERGVKLAISTDAHRPDALELMRYGVDQARRAWLEAEDVLNTYRWEALKELLRR